MDNKSHVSRDDREGEKKITNDDKKPHTAHVVLLVFDIRRE